MELAAVLHHSRDVGPAQHAGPRAQKTANSGGARPEALKDPEPQGGAATVGYVAALVTLVSPPCLQGGDGVDAYHLLFHPVRANEAQRRRKKRKKKKAPKTSSSILSWPCSSSTSAVACS